MHPAPEIATSLSSPLKAPSVAPLTELSGRILSTRLSALRRALLGANQGAAEPVS